MEVRALTVRQPHAWAIIAGRKPVENRTWPFPMPTPCRLLIHAGAKLHPLGLHVPQSDEPGEHVRSAIIGAVTVTDQHHYHPRGPGPKSPCGICGSRWALAWHHHWMLADPVRLPEPIPCRGRLTLFEPPRDVLDRLAQHI